MSKYTPGPWKWDQGDIGEEYGIPYCDVYTGDGETIIASVNDSGDKNIAAANARLIAAAPQMREALGAIIQELLDGDTTSAEQIARHAGCAALKAADGESQ